MGFRKNETQQMQLSDRYANMTERERRFLEKSWAKPFGDYIFPMINESKFEELYCKENGRPNTPVNIIIGSLILAEMVGISDDEQLVESVILDSRFQYALRLTSCEEIPYSDRTPSRFRERLYRHEIETGEDLLKPEIERISVEIAKRMKIDGTLKRMDSLMISSSCKRMGRMELMYTCVSNLVKAAIKAGDEAKLPERLRKYGNESEKNTYCYRIGKDEIQTRLEELTKDALLAYEICSYLQGCETEFDLLERMLSDQTKDGNLKPNKEISPGSLQNPSDEDATFRRKNGKSYQGYVGNIVEDCGENGNIITHYDYDINLHSDSDFAAELIKSMGQQKEKSIITVDGAYPSEANIEAAKKNNIELVPSALSGAEPLAILNEFQISETAIETCPSGQTPTWNEYNEEKGIYRAHFNKETCETCPRRTSCPVKLQKKKAAVTITKTSKNRAALAKSITTERYKELARKRNGIEGVPSVLRRKYRVDEMPVRGLVRSKMWFGFKIGAINVKRLIKFIINTVIFYTKIKIHGFIWKCSIIWKPTFLLCVC